MLTWPRSGVLVLLLLLTPAAAVAQCQWAGILGEAFCPEEGNDFGRALAMDGDHLVAGAPFAHMLGVQSGAAIVFRREEDGWVQEARLIAPVGEYALLGRAVGIFEDTIIVGAPSFPDIGIRGSAFIFRRVSGRWTPEAELTPELEEGEFGFSVTVDGERAVVGAPTEDDEDFDDAGAVYVFRRSQAGWVRESRIPRPDVRGDRRFGHAVALSGDFLAAGAPYGAGSVVIFRRDGSEWALHQEIIGASESLLGYSIAMDGSTLAIRQSPGGLVYELEDGSWQPAAELAAPTEAFLGGMVGLSGDVLVLSPDVRVYRRRDGVWVEEEDLTRFQAPSVAVAGGTLALAPCREKSSLCGSLAVHQPLAEGIQVLANDGQAWLETTSLEAGNLPAAPRLGAAVAGDEDTLVTGAPGATTPRAVDSGAVHVHARHGVTWIAESILTAADGHEGDLFGAAVSFDGDRIAVGAPGADDRGESSGAGYMFRRLDGSWSEEARALAGDGEAGARFGATVALDGDTVVFGAPEASRGPEDSTVTGAVYVFRRGAGGSWSEEARLGSSRVTAGANLGAALALSGEWLVAGAPGDAERGIEAGAATVFRRDGGLWAEAMKLAASDGGARHRFGASVALADPHLVIGAPGASGVSASTGAAYVFERRGEAWVEVQKLRADGGQAGDELGSSASVHVDTALIGAPGSNAVHVFTRGMTGWTSATSFVLGGREYEHGYGSAVHMTSAQTAFVGAQTAGCGRDAFILGSAHILKVLPIPDCDADGTSDTCELIGSPGDDCNSNLVPDACDIATGTSADADGDLRPDECPPLPPTECLLRECVAYTLDGPDEVHVEGPGTTSQATYFGQLTPGELLARGVGGWSMSIAAEGLRLVRGTVEGTVAAAVTDDPPGLRKNGYERTALTVDEGIPGVVSIVILSLTETIELPVDGTHLVLRIDVEFEGRNESGAAALRFQALSGPSHPAKIQNVASAGGVNVDTEGQDKEILVTHGLDPFRRADANGDGLVNISDGIHTLSNLFLGGPRSRCRDAADFDDSGSVVITDPIATFQMLFLGSLRPPPPPGRFDCGPDPTEDPLDCLEYDACD